jgi:tetratricopeptide (TPR) repeat protein
MLEGDRNQARFEYENGLKNLHKKKYTDALLNFDTALDVDCRFIEDVPVPDFEPVRKEQAGMDLALNSNPTHPMLWYGKASLLYQLWNYSDAHFCIKKAIELNSQFAPYWALQGDILYWSGQINLAQESYQKALTIDSHDFNARYGTGMVSLKLKKYSDAIPAFSQADSEIQRYYNSRHASTSSMSIVMSTRLEYYSVCAQGLVAYLSGNYSQSEHILNSLITPGRTFFAEPSQETRRLFHCFVGCSQYKRGDVNQAYATFDRLVL